MKNDKVEICLVYLEDEEYKVERVYATKLDNSYRIESVPAFASNVAYGDIVTTEKEGDDLYFEALVKSSGHSVVHIVFFIKDRFSEVDKGLKDMGVNVNYLSENTYLVIDVPLEVSYRELKLYLDQMFNEGVIDYREACISNQHKINLN